MKDNKKIHISIVLDNVRSAHNVGSVFRNSDAFLVERIFLCGITATPPNRDINKVALGSTESIRWEYKKNTLIAIEELKSQNYFILGIEQTNKSININNFQTNDNEKYALIFGNEINGIGEEALKKCDELVQIPQFGIKKSLNVSVASGIAIWEIFKNIFIYK